VEAQARLCSATASKLLLQTTDTVTVGRHGLYYAGPSTWKCLAAHITDMSMSLQFQKTAEDIAVLLTYISEHCFLSSCICVTFVTFLQLIYDLISV